MKKYLQYRRGYLCIWLLLCSVPILVQLLYGQALESILYGVGLATVLVLLFMVHDFLHFREKEENRLPRIWEAGNCVCLKRMIR